MIYNLSKIEVSEQQGTLRLESLEDCCAQARVGPYETEYTDGAVGGLAALAKQVKREFVRQHIQIITTPIANIRLGKPVMARALSSNELNYFVEQLYK